MFEYCTVVSTVTIYDVFHTPYFQDAINSNTTPTVENGDSALFTAVNTFYNPLYSGTAAKVIIATVRVVANKLLF